MNSLRNFPVKPGGFPFFYGWFLLGVGTLGMLMSIPGQTVGVSVFTDFLIEALPLSRNGISMAYLVGTISSALMLTAGGKAYDRFGARPIATAVTLLLAVTLLALSLADSIAAAVALPFLPRHITAFAVIALGFFFLRFFGQGVLTMTSRNMVMKWFEARRGIANAVLGVSVSLGFSLAPRLLNDLVGLTGWREAWRLMALALAGFAVIVFLFYRDNPERFGLAPDGNAKPRTTRKTAHADAAAARDFTLPEARRTYAFWVLALTLALSALMMTAFTFHVVSIFSEVGMSRSQAVSVFLPASIIAVGSQFIGSWLSDYIPLKRLAMVQTLGAALLSGGILLMSEGLPVYLSILGMGLSQGMMGITGNITWPRYFGRLHLGAISGFAMSLTVAGSAIGPYVFSLSLSLFGSYAAAGGLFAAAALLLFIGTLFVKRPV
jgi:sugar phosphate permease